jgi:hypothetical protein
MCNEMRQDLTLPSGCYLVKINLTKCLYDRICFQQQIKSNRLENSDDENRESDENESEQMIQNEDEDNVSINNDLIMDLLPQSTRFTTTSTLGQLNEIGIDFNRLEDDLNDEDMNWNDQNDFIDTQQYKIVNLYIQKNSRLRLVLMSNQVDSSSNDNDSEGKKDIYQLDNFVRIVN